MIKKFQPAPQNKFPSNPSAHHSHQLRDMKQHMPITATQALLSLAKVLEISQRASPSYGKYCFIYEHRHPVTRCISDKALTPPAQSPPNPCKGTSQYATQRTAVNNQDSPEYRSIPPLTSYKPRANYLAKALAAKSDDSGSVSGVQGRWQELTLQSRATVCMGRSENPSLWSWSSPSTLGPRGRPGSKRLNLMAHLVSLQTGFKVHQNKLQQVRQDALSATAVAHLSK